MSKKPESSAIESARLMSSPDAPPPVKFDMTLVDKKHHVTIKQSFVVGETVQYENTKGIEMDCEVVGQSKHTPPGLILKDIATGRQFAINAKSAVTRVTPHAETAGSDPSIDTESTILTKMEQGTNDIGEMDIDTLSNEHEARIREDEERAEFFRQANERQDELLKQQEAQTAKDAAAIEKARKRIQQEEANAAAIASAKQDFQNERDAKAARYDDGIKTTKAGNAVRKVGDALDSALTKAEGVYTGKTVTTEKKKPWWKRVFGR